MRKRRRKWRLKRKEKRKRVKKKMKKIRWCKRNLKKLWMSSQKQDELKPTSISS